MKCMYQVSDIAIGINPLVIYYYLLHIDSALLPSQSPTLVDNGFATLYPNTDHNQSKPLRQPLSLLSHSMRYNKECPYNSALPQNLRYVKTVSKNFSLSGKTEQTWTVPYSTLLPV